MLTQDDEFAKLTRRVAMLELGQKRIIFWGLLSGAVLSLGVAVSLA